MRTKNSTAYLIMGWVAVSGLIAAVVLVLKNNPIEVIRQTHANRVHGKSAAITDVSQSFQISSHERKPRAGSKRVTNSAASDRLQHHLEVDDLRAVDQELKELSNAGELASVADLLKEWCRGSSIEVSQWCLAYSEENYDELNLALCAEALSNPSDVIREFAAARLENVTGIRFEDSSSARAWLSSQKVR